jgi:hypothetical protein
MYSGHCDRATVWRLGFGLSLFRDTSRAYVRGRLPARGIYENFRSLFEFLLRGRRRGAANRARPARDSVQRRGKGCRGHAADRDIGNHFRPYEEQQGGAAPWTEIQNVPLDDKGRYTGLLGSTQPNGLPLDLFSSGKARWLGVTPQAPGT